MTAGHRFFRTESFSHVLIKGMSPHLTKFKSQCYSHLEVHHLLTHKRSITSLTRHYRKYTHASQFVTSKDHIVRAYHADQTLTLPHQLRVEISPHSITLPHREHGKSPRIPCPCRQGQVADTKGSSVPRPPDQPDALDWKGPRTYAYRL